MQVQSSNRTQKSTIPLICSLQLLTSCAIRSSEFSFSLFLAGIYPKTLLYISIYGLCRSFSAVLLGPSVGGYVDNHDREYAMRLCISYQRISIVLSCTLIIFLRHLPEPQFAFDVDKLASLLCFTLLAFLGSVEKLAAVANLITLERDWLVIVAETHGLRRQDLNASLRRVDLFSKLLAPSIVGLIDEVSSQLAIVVVMVWNIASALLELRIMSQIYTAIPELAHKQGQSNAIEMQALSLNAEPEQAGPVLSRKSLLTLAPWEEYQKSPVFLASFSGCMLWLTVLYVGGPMITYLRSIGFTSLQVTYFRVVSVIAELGGTWLSPVLMGKFGPSKAGMYFLLWQVGCLAIFVGPVLAHDITTTSAGIPLALGIIFKRLGLWGLDLAIQFMVQDTILPASRSRFSATEVANQQIFEMLSSLVTSIYSRPENFLYPILISYGAIISATLCYAWFMWTQNYPQFHTIIHSP